MSEAMPALPTGAPLPTAPTLLADEFLSLAGAAGPPPAKGYAKSLERLVAATPPGDAGLADLVYRLGVHYARLHRDGRALVLELDSKITRAPDARKASLRATQSQAAAASKRALASSIKHFGRLLADPALRTYARMDSAIFHVAYQLQAAGLLRESRKAFLRLVKDHPTSKHVPEAYLAFGDYYFDKGNLANAEKFYRKVMQFPGASVSGYAGYRLGWVYLGTKRHQDALLAFMRPAGLKPSGAAQQRLKDAAIEAFLVAYTHVGRPEKAVAMVKRLDGRRAAAMLERLSQLYGARAQRAQQVRVWRQMALLPVAGAAGDLRACVLHSQILAAEADPELIENAMLDVIHRIAKVRRALPTLAANSPCARMSRVALAKAARAWHARLYESYDEGRVGAVILLHETYVNLAVHAPQELRSEAAFLVAEVLWLRAAAEQDDTRAVAYWREAASRFDAVPAMPEARKADAVQAARYARENADSVASRLPAAP